MASRRRAQVPGGKPTASVTILDKRPARGHGGKPVFWGRVALLVPVRRAVPGPADNGRAKTGFCPALRALKRPAGHPWPAGEKEAGPDSACPPGRPWPGGQRPGKNRVPPHKACALRGPRGFARPCGRWRARRAIPGPRGKKKPGQIVPVRPAVPGPADNGRAKTGFHPTKLALCGDPGVLPGLAGAKAPGGRQLTPSGGFASLGREIANPAGALPARPATPKGTSA